MSNKKIRLALLMFTKGGSPAKEPNSKKQERTSPITIEIEMILCFEMFHHLPSLFIHH
ncbi:hypothetical protein [Anaerosolibacter carboniphilus]|uniref:hypothetical protein n=1 Tax=Anaerosolibacter carboniphilus TaxID=1417629 RepID=UPI001A9BE5CA|nr:hypothetical protein [Anaerosolibacter carboniphilus]